MAAKKILVVDFDQEFLKFLSQFLRNNGFTVITAADGSDGLEKQKSESPDLVITEAMLPKLHGFELCSRITHGATRRTPVIIVTGVYRDTVYKTEALHTFGASAYFEKPLDTEELLISVRRTLGLSEARKPIEDPVDAAIMEALAQSPATTAAPVLPPKPAEEERPRDNIDDMLQSTLAEFGLGHGRNRAPAKAKPAPKTFFMKPGAPQAEKPASPAEPKPAPIPEAKPSIAAARRPVESAHMFGGYGETKKRGVQPRIFGAIAGVLVLTSATAFFLKAGKGHIRPEAAASPVIETDPTKAPEIPASQFPATEAPFPDKKSVPSAARKALKEPPPPNPEDIDPIAPETSLNLEIQPAEKAVPRDEAQPLPAGGGIEDAGATTAGTEASIEAPAVKIRVGDLVPIGDTDVPPRPIRATDPVYPPAAMNMRIEGSVMINALISETGDVIETAVIGRDKGGPGFDKAAENAVRKWRFSPAEKGGVRVRVWKSVTIAFKLKKK